MKKATYDIIMGILPVMIGVYLGIYFNNQNESNKQAELKNQVFKNLLVECQSNLNMLQESQAYFELLHDSSRAYQKKIESYQQFSFWKGLNPPELSRTAFKTAEVTNTLPDISIDLLQSLSRVYSGVEELEELGDAYFFSVVTKTGDPNFSNKQYLIILENYAYDMLVSEEILTREIRTLISLLQTQNQL